MISYVFDVRLWQRDRIALIKSLALDVEQLPQMPDILAAALRRQSLRLNDKKTRKNDHQKNKKNNIICLILLFLFCFDYQKREKRETAAQRSKPMNRLMLEPIP